MAKPAAKQTVTTYNSNSCPKQKCFISSSFPPLLFSSTSSFPSLFLLFHPHPLFFLLSPPLFLFFFLFFFLLISSSSFHPLPESNFLLFFLSIFRSTFYHHLFDVMRLQRYAFIGQMTLLPSKSSGNPADGGRTPQSAPVEFNMKNDGGRRAGSAHVNPETSSDTGAL